MTEEVELYVDAMGIKMVRYSFIYHAYRFQLAFYQPFLDLTDAKITPDIGKRLKFGLMCFLRQ